MSLEVELKYAIESEAGFRRRMEQCDARQIKTEQQRDHYFNHPQRDFAESDEAFRIRSDGNKACLTYKGPKIDKETKTRREIEVPLGDRETSVALSEEMLVCLGFRPVATVSKRRTTYEITWQQQVVTVTWDQVEGVGAFVELERVVSDQDFPHAKACLLSLAAELELREPIQTSYLEMLLRQDKD